VLAGPAAGTDIVRLNPSNFRVLCPDEMGSNRLNAVYEVSKKMWLAHYLPEDADGSELSPDGRVIAYWHKEEKPGAPWSIAVIPAEGGEPRVFEVPQNDANGMSSIHWTTDARAFIYTDYRDGVTNLRLQPLDGAREDRQAALVGREHVGHVLVAMGVADVVKAAPQHAAADHFLLQQ
jgi:hypothetical protein